MPLNTATLKSRQQLTYDVIEVTFETAGPFTFTAGQFVTFKIADKTPPCFRAYSISSLPKNSNDFSTCVKVIPGGRGSNWLNSLKIGDRVEFLGPNGNLAFKTSQGKTAIFIATGTGITPFKSMIKDELTKGNSNKINLIFGLRYIKDIFYKEYFEELAKKYQNFTFEITLSRPENDSWKGKVGRVTDILNKTTIDTRNTEFYICGLKDMIAEVTTILKNKGVPKNAINMEKYD